MTGHRISDNIIYIYYIMPYRLIIILEFYGSFIPKRMHTISRVQFPNNGVDGLTFRMPTNRVTLFPVIIFQI